MGNWPKSRWEVRVKRVGIRSANRDWEKRNTRKVRWGERKRNQETREKQKKRGTRKGRRGKCREKTESRNKEREKKKKKEKKKGRKGREKASRLELKAHYKAKYWITCNLILSSSYSTWIYGEITILQRDIMLTYDL
jgi:hypothetical protein